MKKAIAGLAGLGVSLAAAVMFASPVMAANTTAQGLVNANNDKANWLLHHRTYDGHRYSPLSEVNSDNVKGLQLRFITMLDGLGSGGKVRTPKLQGTPLVEDGFLYVTDGWNNVYKIDARSGDRGSIVWKFDPEMDRAYAADSGCCQGRNRGVALINDLVIESTMDGRMIALDKSSGEIVWQAKTADNDLMESHTGAPLALKNLAINGVTGAEYGIRGHINAIDVTTGEESWVKHLIPAPGEPGHETWVDDYQAWQTGGASVWQTGTYDPDLNIMYWGTGNPSPQYDSEYRPGDNLYTESVVAMDPDNGDILWHFQFTPNDPYDWDEVGETQLIDIEVGGETRKIVTRAARNGFVYGFDRANGELRNAIQYVDFENWTLGGIDQKTGLPMSYNPDTPVQLYAPGTAGRRDGRLAVFCPALGGGKNWQPAAYSGLTGLNYVPANEGCSAYHTTVGGVDHWKDKGNKMGALENRHPPGWRGRERAPGAVLPVPVSTGSITGYDPATGQTVVKVSIDTRPTGMLATAGNLVFTGMATDLMAFNSTTLELLFAQNMGTGLSAPPMTYSYGGRQYVAILAGSTVSRSASSRIARFANVVPTSILAVFSL